MSKRILASLAIAGLLGASSAHAVILQGGGEDYIAWEAESDITITNDGNASYSWAVTADANAGGGQRLEALGAPNNGQSPADFASWQVQFNTAGTYRLYVKREASTYNTLGPSSEAASNSMHVSASFGASPTIVYDNTDKGTGDYIWVNGAGGNNGFTPVDLVVSAGQVGTPLTLTFAIREGGWYVDRIVLSAPTGLDGATLDSYFVPEPATLGLAGLGALALIARRRTHIG